MSMIVVGFNCESCGKSYRYGRDQIGLFCEKCGATLRDPHAPKEFKPTPKQTFGVLEVAVGVVVFVVLSLAWGNIVGFGSSDGPDYCDVSFCR